MISFSFRRAKIFIRIFPASMLMATLRGAAHDAASIGGACVDIAICFFYYAFSFLTQKKLNTSL